MMRSACICRHLLCALPYSEDRMPIKSLNPPSSLRGAIYEVSTVTELEGGTVRF